MKKRFLSVMMTVVLLVSNLSGTALAAETDGEAAVEQVQVVEEVQSESKSEPVVEEPKEEEPKEEEHLENGGECLVWVNCSLIEGCEGPEGHEGECYGAALYAEDGGTITVSNAKSAYIVVGTKDGIKNDTLYRTDRNGVICDLNGTEVVFEEGTYYIWYGTAGATANRSFYAGSVDVESSSETIRLSATSNSKASSASTITENQWNCLYSNSIGSFH